MKVIHFLQRTYFIPLLLVLVAGIIFHAPLHESFWLDETLTRWIIADDFYHAVFRAFEFQGQSPLYYGILYGWGAVAGVSESSLRIFSLMLYIGSGLVFYLLLVRLSFDSVARAAGTMVFLIHDVGAPLAISARPYAFTLFFVMVCGYTFIRWLQCGGIGRGLLYVISGAAMFYAHYFTAPVILAQFIWVICSRQKSFTSIFSTYLWMGLLCSGAGPQLSFLYHRKQEVFFEGLTTLEAMRKVLIPTSLMVTVLLSAVILILSKHKKLFRHEVWLLAVGAVFTAGVIFIFGAWLHLPLAERYFLWSIPLLPLFTAYLSEITKESEIRSFFVVLIFVFSVIIVTERKFYFEDFRSAAALAHEWQAQSPNTPILLFSGLAEQRSGVGGASEEVQRYLSAPLSVYGATRVVPLLFEAREEMAEVAAQNNNVVILVARKGTYFSEKSPDVWIESLQGKGFAEGDRQEVSGISIIRLTK